MHTKMYLLILWQRGEEASLAKTFSSPYAIGKGALKHCRKYPPLFTYLRYISPTFLLKKVLEAGCELQVADVSIARKKSDIKLLALKEATSDQGSHIYQTKNEEGEQDKRISPNILGLFLS